MLRAGQRLAVVLGNAERILDQLHHRIDFADDTGADLVDAVRRAVARQIGLVDQVEVGFRELAVTLQRFIDDAVDGGVVAGRVNVPDLVVARDGALPQRLDLTERNVGECVRSFFFA